MDCIVIPIVWTIAGVNAPTWYNATHNYRPQRSCGKVMFLHLSAILPDTPQTRGRHPLDQRQTFHPPSEETATAADGTHPIGMHSCYVNSSHNSLCLKNCRCEKLFSVIVAIRLQILTFNVVSCDKENAVVGYYCRPQQSNRKVRFLHLCVILFTEGVSVQWGLFSGVLCPEGGLCPGRSLSGESLSRGSLSGGSLSMGSVQGGSVQGNLCLGGSLSRVVFVQGVSVQGGLCPGCLCPGCFCPGGLCPGVSVQGVSIQGVSIQGSLSRVCPSRVVSVHGVSVHGVSVQGSLSRGVSVQGVSVQGVYVKGDLCPGGSPSG